MSGRDPIDPGRRRADHLLMTLLLSPPRDRSMPLSGRFGRPSLDDLRDRIERSDYAVEPELVAEAILDQVAHALVERRRP